MASDAFGHLLDAFDRGRTRSPEIVERDDGYFTTGGGAEYLAPYRRWPPVERRALRYARGRVLDVGCGAGRVLIRLQERGFDAVGVEASPLVAKVARRRGARNVRVMRVEKMDRRLGTFDTVVMYGNNLGMFGTIEKTQHALRTLLDVTSADARILAGNWNPYPAGLAVHRAYHARNRRRGKPAGTIRIRLRFREHVTPWFQWLFLSPRELAGVLRTTGWHVKTVIQDDQPAYVAILDKATRGAHVPGAKGSAHPR